MKHTKKPLSAAIIKCCFCVSACSPQQAREVAVGMAKKRGPWAGYRWIAPALGIPASGSRFSRGGAFFRGTTFASCRQFPERADTSEHERVGS